MDRQFGGASIGVDVGGDNVTATASCTAKDRDSDDEISDFVPFRRNAWQSQNDLGNSDPREKRGSSIGRIGEDLWQYGISRLDAWWIYPSVVEFELL